MSLAQKILFRLRMYHNPRAALRRLGWQLQGARFGRGVIVPALQMTWPHQVSVGADCILEPDVFFKYDGGWQPGPAIRLADRVFVGRGTEFNVRSRITVGEDCLIASGCKFIDHDHAMEVGLPMNRQPCPEAPIVLESDSWLGVNVVVLKGVTVGTGAVVGAGAVLTKSVPPYEIWGGVPARKIGQRARPTQASASRDYAPA